MKPTIYFTLFLFAWHLTVPVRTLGQTMEGNITQPNMFQGRILDAETGLPLSYATVSINPPGIGTVSNQDGNWSLKIPEGSTQAKLSVHFMGYTSQTYDLLNLKTPVIVRLKPSHFELSEIVVMPGDFIKELLGKAYKSIPENYPISPTLCDGFFRETQRVNDSLFLYFDEAILNVYKNTYKNTRNFGQIRIEKSRKNVFPGIDTINNVRFYGGPHFPNDLDIVFSRWDFIRPSEYKNWTYELTGSFKDSLSEVYVVTFKNKKAPHTNFQGRMFIDKNNLAYIGFELRRSGPGSISSEQNSTDVSYLPGNTTVKIGYVLKDGCYHLGYITYKTNGINTETKTRIYKDIEYVTTSIQTDSVSPIPFNQQFDYTDILSIEAANYDQSYWKDYNVLQESNSLNTQTNLLYQKEQAMAQLAKTYNTELSRQEKVLLFLKRFRFDGGIAYDPINLLGGNYTVYIDQSNAQGNKNVASKHFGLSTVDGIRFELTKQVALFTTLSAALYGVSQVQLDAGVLYRHTLFPSGRWIFLDLGLAASQRSSKTDLCTILNRDENVRIDGKTFDSKNIDVKAGKSGFGVKPVASLAVRMGKKYELFTEGSYFLPLLFKREYLQFKESDGFFLNRKHAKLEWDDPALFVNIDGTQIKQSSFEVSPFQFRIGIRSGF